MEEEIRPDLIMFDPVINGGIGMATPGKLRRTFPLIAVVVLIAVVDTALQIDLEKLGIYSVLE